MANSNGGRTCPKCGMNLGQKHLCPVCDVPPESERPYGSRTCPKCGMNLGQKHLCPVCDKTEDITESSASNPTAETGENGALAFLQEHDYVSSVIGFMEGHRDDWDDAFNAFFDGLDEKPDFDECFEACSQVKKILETDMSSGRISGSMTRQTMTKLRDVFPELTSEEARKLAMYLLHERLDSIFAPPPPGSDPEVMKLYYRAMEQNDAEAQNRLGYAYAHGEGVNQNYTEAVKWYRKAAEQEYASAQYSLGYCYDQGKGVSENKSEAVKWIRKAAEQGHATAQFHLGSAYSVGEGVNQNFSEAMKWICKAAEQGHAEAQYSLGYAYDHGKGVSQNHTEAVKWYRKAADQGVEKARISLELAELIIALPDKDFIRNLCRRAVEQNDAEAMKTLGNFLFYGIGVDKDLTEAVKWYRKAAEWGSEYARKKLKELGY